MKILIVQDHLRSGGTERQTVLLANAFAAAGHHTSLLTFRPGGPLEGTVTTQVDRCMLQARDTGWDWFAPRLLSTARDLAPDIVLTMGRMANCYAGSLQRRLTGRPRHAVVIATMRTGKPLPALFRRSLRLVRHIVANSHAAHDTLVKRHRIPTQKISVIHNSLVFPERPVERNSVATESLRREHGASAGTTVLLCVAMFRPEKNQRELIEIAAGLPRERDWQLWLAGDGPARAACEQLVASMNLSSRVRFLGLVRNPSALYASADIAIHASSSESLSNFLIEAQAHGLPAVAYLAQGIRESFIPERTGWAIARGDRHGFRAAIERIMNVSSWERTARAVEARDYARNHFDPARQVAAYLDLFAQLRASR